MKRIGAFEAKTQLSRLLREVERGETVEILRNGHPIARLVPIRAQGAKTVSEAVEHLLGSRATLGGVSIKELRDAGRRY